MVGCCTRGPNSDLFPGLDCPRVEYLRVLDVAIEEAIAERGSDYRVLGMASTRGSLVRPVDRDGGVFCWVDARVSHGLDHNLVLFVAHNGHDLAVKFLDDVGWQRRNALVGPKYLAI